MTIREKLTRQKRFADMVSIAGIGGATLFFYVASSFNRWWVLREYSARWRHSLAPSIVTMRFAVPNAAPASPE